MAEECKWKFVCLFYGLVFSSCEGHVTGVRGKPV